MIPYRVGFAAICLIPSIAAAQMPARQFMLAPANSATSVMFPPLKDGEDGRTRALVSALSKANPPKGEFETTAAFQQRLKQAQATELAPGIKRTDRIAFPFPINQNLVTYDADKQVFTIRRIEAIGSNLQVFLAPTDFGFRYSPQSSSYKFLDVDREGTSETTSGRNAFGASVPVQHADTDHWGVLLDTHVQQAGQIAPQPNYAKWPMLRVPRADAPNVKFNLIGLIIGRVGDPPILGDSYRHVPTISDPRDTTNRKHVINLTLEAFWIVRGDTGAVLAKMSAADLLPMSDAALHAQQCVFDRAFDKQHGIGMAIINHCD